jgi:DNA-binding GntR family transcriptional regulator
MAGPRRPSAPMNDPLVAPSLVEITTRRLRDEILSGALEPGGRLIEEQICQRFSISRAPVREAMRLLAQQGLVEHLPRRGARVTVWSAGDIAQLFEIRALLESHAISTAFPLDRTAGADPLTGVKARLADMASAQEDGDDLAKDDAHRAFHAEIVALAGNRQLNLALEPILLKLQRPMAVNLRLEASIMGPGEGLRRHAGLVSALETNDRAVVLEALRYHGGQRYLDMRDRARGGGAVEHLASASAR